MRNACWLVACCACAMAVLSSRDALAQGGPPPPGYQPATGPGQPAPVAAAPPPYAGAPAPPDQPSERPTVWMLAIERVAGFSVISASSEDGEDGLDATAFALGGPIHNPFGMPRIGVDAVLSGGFELGGAVGFLSATGDETSNGTKESVGSVSAYLISPRIGYRITASDDFDVLLRGGFGFAGAKYQEPSRSGCTSFDPIYGGCTYGTVEGDTNRVSAVLLSLDPTLVWRLTTSFNLLGGVAYDKVLSASGETERPSLSATQVDKSDFKGTVDSIQLWLGVGGYL